MLLNALLTALSIVSRVESSIPCPHEAKLLRTPLTKSVETFSSSSSVQFRILTRIEQSSETCTRTNTTDIQRQNDADKAGSAII